MLSAVTVHLRCFADNWGFLFFLLIVNPVSSALLAGPILVFMTL